MADTREPPPDLFDAEENISEDEAVDEPAPTEDMDVDDVQGTVEVSLDNEESVADENNEGSTAEASVTEPASSEDLDQNEAENEPEQPSKISDEPEEKTDKDKSEDKVCWTFLQCGE